jgi:alpha-acetolactate decarboxylase
VHFISEDKTIMGHLDDIHVKNQTVTFMFPAKSGTIGNLKIKTNDTDLSKGRLGNQYR